MKAKIDFRVNDAFSAVRAALSRLYPLERALRSAGCVKADAFHLDLSRCDYIGPDGATILARLCLIAKYHGHQLSILPPQAPPELRAFWHHSGLECFADGSVQRVEQIESQQPVLPLKQFTEARFTDADPLICLIKQHEKLSADLEEYLRICVNEVIQNVQDHAASQVGAIMAGRYMRSARQVRVAIVDDGAGICSTLSRQYSDLTPELALKRVTQGGYSALSRPNNMGLGISNLCQIVTSHLHGEMFIISETASVEIRAGRQPNVQSLDCRFAGTGVFFTLPVSE